MPSSVLLGVWSSPLQDEAEIHTSSECPNGVESVSTDPLCLCTLKLSTWSSRGCSRLFGLPVIPGGATAEMRNQHQWPHRCDWFRRINWLLYRFACTCQGRSHEEGTGDTASSLVDFVASPTSSLSLEELSSLQCISIVESSPCPKVAVGLACNFLAHAVHMLPRGKWSDESKPTGDWLTSSSALQKSVLMHEIIAVEGSQTASLRVKIALSTPAHL